MGEDPRARAWADDASVLVARASYRNIISTIGT